MKQIIKYIISSAIIYLLYIPVNAQSGAITHVKDTVYTYISPRPLIENQKTKQIEKNSAGLEVMFSGSGVGLGFFYYRDFAEDLSGFVSFFISGVRNSDEYEYYGVVFNKVNRLIEFPLMLGIRKLIFEDALFESFKPYISAGFGPSFILAGPYKGYEFDFFKSMGQATFYTRFGGNIGIGANIGGVGNATSGVNLRYYYIPFGGNGIESIQDLPITNFGGVFLTLSIGRKF
ncbi:MAG: hypothetical protein QG635_822 [Bacteroidota bacterium]|nr:hypothetical protein [Bacteroidota bacterium]